MINALYAREVETGNRIITQEDGPVIEVQKVRQDLTSTPALVFLTGSDGEVIALEASAIVGLVGRAGVTAGESRKAAYTELHQLCAAIGDPRRADVDEDNRIVQELLRRLRVKLNEYDRAR